MHSQSYILTVKNNLALVPVFFCFVLFLNGQMDQGNRVKQERDNWIWLSNLCKIWETFIAGKHFLSHIENSFQFVNGFLILDQ